MRANLHVHSKFSDGTQWPEEIVARAQRFGLEMISLTDHDSTEGIASFLTACAIAGILGIPGVEIDCQITNRPGLEYGSEILAYFPRGSYPNTLKLLQSRLEMRRVLMQGYISTARSVFGRSDLNFEGFLAHKLGFWNEYVEDLKFAAMKPDLLSYLQQEQVLPANLLFEEFKSRYFFGDRKQIVKKIENIETLGDMNGNRPSMEDVVNFILDDGGYAVLPHPGHWFWGDNKEIREIQTLLNYCKEIGVWGVELYYYPTDNDTINAIIHHLAEDLDLHLTFGTDCHGRGSSRDTLERAWMDLEFPEWDRSERV